MTPAMPHESLLRSTSHSLGVALIAATLAGGLGCAFWTGESGGANKDEGKAGQPEASATEPAAGGAPATNDAAATAADSAPLPAPETLVASAPSTEGLILRLNGSTTVGASLAPRLAMGYLTHLGLTNVQLHKERKAENHLTVTGDWNGHPESIEIDYPGTAVGFGKLLAGECDVAMASRPIRPEEVHKLARLGDMTAAGEEHVIAMDGIAVIVNRVNRINQLSLKQLAGIFSGQTTSWADLGGNGPIHVYSRERTSGTYEAFTQFVLGGKDITVGKPLEENEAVATAVTNDEFGVGFVGLPFVRETKALALQDGDATAQLPTSLSVSTEDYPLSRRLFLYTPDLAQAREARSFAAYVTTDEGQRIVAQEGFIALSALPVQGRVLEGAPDAYRQAVTGASRLPFNVHFKSGTVRLDGKARTDLARASRALGRHSSKQLILLGFADRSGNESQNVEYSRVRANAVAMALKNYGFETSVLGLGSALPVAPNDTSEGRDRNRRVELWVR